MSDQDIDSNAAAMLFEVKKNQLKMMQRRGYDIDREKNLLKITLEQFLAAYIPHAQKQRRSLRSVLTNVYENEAGERILVYYADVSHDSTQLGLSEISAAIAEMEKYKLRNAVIITQKSLSPSATKHIAGLVSLNIQIFLEEEMSYDPTEHFLVPEHIPLTMEEQTQLLQEKDLDIDQLPVILTTDIMARYYGLRGGRVVKIVRTNMYQTMVIKSLSYRVVKEEQ
jgi:DNA-directed RNA polymerase I, II, and III subunit RPABC1